MRLFLIVSVAAMLLTGCHRSGPLPDLDVDSQPFDPIAFFNGHVRSWGVMESRSGAPTGWVQTDCQGHIDGLEHLRMVQHLSFQHDQPRDLQPRDRQPQDWNAQDLKAPERIWTLWRTGPHSFKATANDMVGSAEGEAVGPAFHWQWVLAPDHGDRPFNVTMNQWMYRMDDGSVMIRTTVSKFDFIVTEITEQFRQDPAR